MSASAGPPSPHLAPHVRAWLLLAALLLLLGFAFQGTRGLWSPDEGRFTGGAVQMLDSGHWLLPRYSPDQPNLSKPPLTYWLIAASVAAFGHDTWAVRAPYALAYALTALLAALIAQPWMHRRAWLAGLVYGLALGPFLTANIVSTDVFLALFEALAMLGVSRALLQPAARTRWLLLAGAGFGLGFLTKGPPALLPLLGMLPYALRRGGWRAFAGLFAPAMLLPFLLLGASWYVLIMLRLPGAAHTFLYREVYERVFTATQERNPQWYGGFKVYLPFLLLATLPWWPALGRPLRQLLRRDAWRRWWHEADPALLLWPWVLLPLLVFFLARSRLPLYVLPLLLPLCLLAARQIAPHVDLRRRGQRAALLLWVLLLLAIKAGAALYLPTRNDERALATQLRAMTGTQHYAALLFAEDAHSAYQREQRTPWGLDLYLRRPVYAVAWAMPTDRPRLCAALHTQGSLLVVAAASVAQPVRTALRGCAASVQTLGTLRDHRVLLARAAAG